MYSKIEEKNSQSPRKIFYWNGIVDPRGLSAHYEELLGKLADGNYQGLDLEKLVGHDVYSVRVNHSDRLLFTTIMVNDQPYLMLLDEVLNHDYAKSRFLKPAVLKHYLELHGKAITEELVNAHFEAHTRISVPAAPQQSPQGIQYSRIDFYNQKFIELDALQLDAATKASLPLIISGAPGSGKSCIALVILGQYVESCSEPTDYPILYVTESEKLASSMQRAWCALPVAQGLPANAVHIKSYQQLITELVPKTANMTFVDKEHCKIWIGNRIKQSANQRKGKSSLSKEFFADIDGLYQEFRIISGCVNKAAYMSLGQRQCLYHDKIQKDWLFSAFTAYQKELETKDSIHAPFYHLDMQDQYKRIVVDESQDFSHLQLKILAGLACKRQICFCEDNRQSLSDNKSKIPFLKALLHSWGVQDKQINLQTSYRCPQAVIRMANAVSGLKSIATGEGQPDIVTPLKEASEGQVTWYDSLTDTQQDTLQQAAQNADFAIVTLEQYKEEARKRFNTALVFTAEECKGLEYKHILAYKLLDAPIFKKADKVIGEKSQNFKKNTNRAKNGQGQEQYGPVFSSLYTAYTRAMGTLSIYQEKRHDLANICDVLIKAVSGEQAVVSQTTTTTTTPEEQMSQWFQQARIQIVHGNIEIARSIFIDTLHKTEADFETFRALYSKAAPAVVPRAQTETTTTASSRKISPVSTNKPKAETGNERVYTYLGNIIKNPSEVNLHKLLKHNRAKAFLFDYPLEDGACLFTQLFYEPSSRKALMCCISEYAKLVAEGITEDALCRPRTAQAGKLANTSPLYWLSTRCKGQEIFQTLLACNPKLAGFISVEALCLPRPAVAGMLANISPLYCLAETTEGCDILKTLFARNPGLAKSISGEALCLPATPAAGECANVSPLYSFATTTEGCEILKILFAGNPKLAQSISARALCLARLAEAGEEAYTSALYFLSGTIEGLEILQSLLILNPRLSMSITAAALCLACSEEAGEFVNTSALYYLSTSLTGLKILQTLFDCNHKLAQSISAESLCLARPSKAGKYANTTVLYFLTGVIEGQKVLQTLLACNPKLAESITAEALCLPSTIEARENANISPLYSLLATDEGWKILHILFASNPKLAESFTAEALCVARTAEAGQNANTSVLYFLSEEIEGQVLLQTMLTGNPKLAESISAEALCLPITPAAGEYANMSPLYCFSETSEGCKILQTLFVCNPKLAESIGLEALCLARTEEAGEYANMSPLNLLSLTSEGRAVLEILRASNQELDKLLRKDASQSQLSKMGLFSNTGVISSANAWDTDNYFGGDYDFGL